MNYGEILTKAWQTIWKHKVLWIFGILASCATGGGGGGGGSNSGYRFNGGEGQGGPSPFDQINPMMERASQFLQAHMWIVVLAVALICVLAIIAILLGTIGKIGLIKGVLKSERGAEKLGFGELWRESLPYFWRIFLLSLLVGLASGLLVLLLLLPFILLTAVTLGLGLICLLPIICLLIPVGWAVNLVLEQATIAIVEKNLGIVEGLSAGWQLVRANLGSMFVMSLLLFVMSLVFGLVLILPALLAFAPLIAAFLLKNVAARAALIVGIACLAIFIPVLIVLKGMLIAYIQTVWTLTYLRLTGYHQADAIEQAPDPEPA